MGIVRTIEYMVLCDKPGCDGLEDYQAFYKSREAEKEWIKRGWKKVGSKWFCPKHTAHRRPDAEKDE